MGMDTSSRQPWHVSLDVRVGAIIPLAAIAIVWTASPAHAQEVDAGFVEQLTDIFVQSAANWEDALRNLAVDLFDVLVVIEIVWSVGWSLLSGLEIAGLLGLLARQLVTIGFFYWLLQGGTTYPKAIIDSFSQAAGMATRASGGVTVSRPEDIIAVAMKMATVLWQGFTWKHPGLDVLLAISGVLILVVLVFAAATLVEVIVEAALVAYAGVVLLGFGGTSFTRQFTLSYLHWAVSIGVKKMFVMLILGLGVGVMQRMAATVPAATDITVQEVAVILAVPLLFWRLAEKLPYKAQDIISGSSPHHPLGLMQGASQVARVAMTAAMAASGGGAAVTAAYNLAQDQLSGGGGGSGSGGSDGGGSGGGSSSSGGGRPSFRATAAQAARNLGVAARDDVGMRLTGDTMTKLRHAGWRIASGMNKEAEAIRNKKDEG
jgi:type IV secretion system protein TrbL